MTNRKQVPMDGTLSGAISGEVSSLLHRYTGREPTQARTFVHDDLIVCLLGDTIFSTPANAASSASGCAELPTQQLVAAYDELGTAVIGLEEVPIEKVER